MGGELEGKSEVLFSRALDQCRALMKIRDSAAVLGHRSARHWTSSPQDLAAVHRIEEGQRSEQHTLAGARRTRQDDAIATVNLECRLFQQPSASRQSTIDRAGLEENVHCCDPSGELRELIWNPTNRFR